MRTLTAAFLATTLVASSAFGAFAATSGAPLPKGQPAGVKQAAMLGPNVVLIMIGAGVVIGGIALAVSGGNNDGVTTPTTTSTSTTGLP